MKHLATIQSEFLKQAFDDLMLDKGSVIKLQGIPFELRNDTAVQGKQENLELMNGVDATDKRLHVNYVQDHTNCPICGIPYKMTCRCRIGDKSCQNGHSWHTCGVHSKVFIGNGSHKMGCLKMTADGKMSPCVCPMI